MSWTPEQLRDYEARQNRAHSHATGATGDVSMPVGSKVGQKNSKEIDLHNEIKAFCAKKGWICFHGSTAHRAYRTLGEPDFTILAENGRFFMAECKTRTGKLSPEQLGLKLWAEKLGHTIYVVRSMDDFMALAAGK